MTTTSPASPDREEQLLRLQRMDRKLVEGLFKHPGVVNRRCENQLRYALALAALDTFQPGAAKKGGLTNRPDVVVRSQLLAGWRRRVLTNLGNVLVQTKNSRERVEAANRALYPMLPNLAKTRAEVISKYVNDFSARELDQELGIKTLVTVAGGGGGSGYVYLGAWDVLQSAGLIPGYVIGASIGAVLGLFRARDRFADFDEYLRLAKKMRRDQVFRFLSIKTRYGLPGIMRLYLHAAIGGAFRDDQGCELLLPDLDIPYEAVVAGVRRRALGEDPEQYARSHHLALDEQPSPLQLRAQIASQLVRLVGFINPRAVQEIVIGADKLTEKFNAIDAAGFSAAIPGILHYDVTGDDPRMDSILRELMERENVIALVDGGVANNIPSRTAWRQVRSGKIGTRNCYFLAFDCFHPQMGFGHIWLQPITRLVAYQVQLSRRYAQKRIEFRPTLSPLNLLPSAEELDRSIGWGRRQMSQSLPEIQKSFERVRWVAPAN